MSDMQLSFLSTEPTAYDVNAVDDGIIHGHGSHASLSVQSLGERAVDDTVLGLGFTNWRALIDHAIRTGHYELFDNDSNGVGLRKSGFKHAPIPCLPAEGVRYAQQRILLIASEKVAGSGRHEKMVAVTPAFAHKCVFDAGNCDLTVKLSGQVIRASVAIDDLMFSSASVVDADPLAMQLAAILVSAGASAGDDVSLGCKSLASYVLRYGQGLR